MAWRAHSLAAGGSVPGRLRHDDHTGWRAIEAKTGGLDSEAAWRVLTEAAGVPADSSVLVNGIGEAEVIRRALMATHPDRGGKAEDFARVQEARRVLRGDP